MHEVRRRPLDSFDGGGSLHGLAPAGWGEGRGTLDRPGAGAALSSLMQTYACLHNAPASAAAASDLMLIARDNLISNQNSKSQISETANENCEMRVDKWEMEERAESGKSEKGSGILCVYMKMQSSFAFDLRINEAIKAETTTAATATS